MNVLRPVISKSQVERLANVLSNVYYDEPPFTYVIPDAHERRAALPAFFRSAIGASQVHGETYTTPAVEGGSLWIGPGRSVTIERMLRTESSTIPFKVSRSILKRCVAFGEWTEKIRLRLIKQPRWHLLALGAAPANEEKSLREALIEPILSRADSYRIPCYLETFNERNLPFYEEHGFCIEGGGRVLGFGPNFWAMLRVPR